jgi:hypothetical protein
MSMRHHAHSHAGGKCEHEAAPTASRRRSPSPVTRYAPIPTVEQLQALSQSIRNNEDARRSQERPEVLQQPASLRRCI